MKKWIRKAKGICILNLDEPYWKIQGGSFILSYVKDLGYTPVVRCHYINKGRKGEQGKKGKKPFPGYWIIKRRDFLAMRISPSKAGTPMVELTLRKHCIMIPDEEFIPFLKKPCEYEKLVGTYEFFKKRETK